MDRPTWAGTAVVAVQYREDRDGLVVYRPMGELDAYTASRFAETVADVEAAERSVIDLSCVPFVDSSGLKVLVALVRRIREKGGEAVMTGPRDLVRRLLMVSGVDQMVTVTGTFPQALAVLGDADGMNGPSSN